MSMVQSSQILVAYSTVYGSTREVAEAVAASLRERGLAVDVQAARDVRALDGYNAVVLGTALRIGHWYKDTGAFLTRHREALGALPVAVFALGPLSGPADEAGWKACRATLDREIAKTPWLKPVAVELFGGKYDPAGLNFVDKLLTRPPASPLHGLAAADVRDFPTIRAWASDLAAQLEPSALQRGTDG